MGAAAEEGVMRLINNFFESYRYTGTFEIRNGRLLLPAAEPCGTRVLIEGSRFSDGLHILEDVPQFDRDESFSGTVRVLAPPEHFIRLCRKLEEEREKAGLTGERFGDYSYTRLPGEREQLLLEELAPYRRMFSE